MKKIILLASLMLAGNSFAGELTNYGMLKNAVMQGKKISVVVDGSKCEVAGNDHNAKELYYSFTPNHLNLEPADLDGVQTISTSANYIETIRTSTVIINAEFSIKPNNKADVSITYYDFATRYPITGRAMECPLSTGVHIFTS